MNDTLLYLLVAVTVYSTTVGVPVYVPDKTPLSESKTSPLPGLGDIIHDSTYESARHLMGAMGAVA